MGEEIEDLQERNKDEIQVLETKLSEKDSIINETDSKMSMISVYVDQLEERLASFALLRREITEREEACQELEEKDLELRKEYESIKEQLVDLRTEKEELKKLSDLLNEERIILQGEKDILINEKDALLLEKQRLKDEYLSLADRSSELEAELESTVAKLRDVEQEIGVKDESLQTLKDESTARVADTEKKLSEAESLVASLKEQLEEVELENEKASDVISLLEKEIIDSVETIKRLEEEHEKKGQENIALSNEIDRNLLKHTTDPYESDVSEEIEESSTSCLRPEGHGIQDEKYASEFEEEKEFSAEIYTPAHHGAALDMKSDYPPPPPPPPPVEHSAPNDFESRQSPNIIFPPPKEDFGHIKATSSFGMVDRDVEQKHIVPPPPPPPPYEVGIDNINEHQSVREYEEIQDSVDGCSFVDVGSNSFELPLKNEGHPETETAQDDVIHDDKDEMNLEVEGEVLDVVNDETKVNIGDECESSEIIDLDAPELQSQEIEMTQMHEEMPNLNFSEKEEEGEDQHDESIPSGYEFITKDEEDFLSEPELPNQSEETPDFYEQSTKKKVPFRKQRKFFSRITGIHGAFTTPSVKEKK